jgi:hypothetical protein
MSDSLKLTTNLSNIIAHGSPQDLARAIAVALFDCYNPLNTIYDRTINFTDHDENTYDEIYKTVCEFLFMNLTECTTAAYIGGTMLLNYTREYHIDVSTIKDKLYQGKAMNMIDELFGITCAIDDDDKEYKLDWQRTKMQFTVDKARMPFILLGFCKGCIAEIIAFQKGFKVSEVDTDTHIEYLKILLFITLKLLIART